MAPTMVVVAVVAGQPLRLISKATTTTTALQSTTPITLVVEEARPEINHTTGTTMARGRRSISMVNRNSIKVAKNTANNSTMGANNNSTSTTISSSTRVGQARPRGRSPVCSYMWHVTCGLM